MMMPKIVILSSDLVIFAMLCVLGIYIWHLNRSKELRSRWIAVAKRRSALVSITVLVLFFSVAVLDSVHYRSAISSTENGIVYDVKTRSLLDQVLPNNSQNQEKSYSSPFAIQSFEKTTLVIDGKIIRDFEPLMNAGKHLEDRAHHTVDVIQKISIGVGLGLILSVGVSVIVTYCFSRTHHRSIVGEFHRFFLEREEIPYEIVLLVLSIFFLIAGIVFSSWPFYHVLGTDQTGNDILYQAIKSIRTAVVIGSLSTLAMLPFAIIFGISAGYYKGWVDDVIQYLYTTLSSIPGVLLIAASVLMTQVFIDSHPHLYETDLERADIRLLMLSLIIGITGWATLARLLRAETLKISQLDYVQAAHAFGVSHFKIMRRHIFPNVVHIVLIVAVLDFSNIVLYEAVLSYVGVGVDPSTYSFGSMINAGRLELSKNPVVWWNLLTAFVFMLTFVLTANLFASAVRDAFDPKHSLNTSRKGK